MDVAPVSSLGICNTYDELCDIMYCAFCEISLLPLAQQNEGAVIYFIKRCNDDGVKNSDRVISMSKIENLEYNILYDMCNKLRTFNRSFNNVVELTVLK